MYALNDKRSAVIEVQRYLYLISNTTHPYVPRVSIDGIYGVETEVAVRAFQAANGIEITGKVDYQTFQILSLAAEVSNDRNAARKYLITGEGLPLKKNMMNDDVVVLHTMISEIQKTYDYLTEVNRTSYFSNQTEKAVFELQELFGLEPTGEVDAAMLERLIIELDSIKLADLKYV